MKKLLGLLAVTPLAVTACGGGGTANAQMERSETKATTEVKEAFQAMLEAATGKIYDSKDAESLSYEGTKPTNAAEKGALGLIEGNWFGGTDSLFEATDIDALTMGQAYRAAMYFGIDTWKPFTQLAEQSGQLLNGFMANTVNGAKASAPAAYFPVEAKALVDAIKEADGSASYSIESYQNTGTREDVYTNMSADLNLIGISTSANTTDWATHLADTQAGKHDAYIGGWGTVTNHPAYGLYGPYHTESGALGGNRGFYSNSEVDAKLDAGKIEGDSDAAEILYNDAQDLIAKDFMQVPLYVGDRRALVGPKVTDVPYDAIQKDGSHYLHGFNTGDTQLVVGASGNFRSLHPHGSNDSGSTNINKNVYQTLWNQNSHAIDPAGPDAKFDPVLITETSIEDSMNVNGVVTVTVNTAAKWHDGSNLTALEVVESINRAIGSTAISAVTNGVLGARLGDIGDEIEILCGVPKEGYEAYGDWVDADNAGIDETKVDIKTFSSWRQNIAHAGFAINKVALDDHKDTAASVQGTGPYKVQAVDVSTKDVTLVSVGTNWDGIAPLNSGIEFRVIADDTARTTAFEGGEVDFIDAVTTANYGNTDAKNDKLSYASWVTGFIGFNLDQF